MKIDKQFWSDGSAMIDRRVADRRSDSLQFRLTARAFALRRTFGAETAYGLMCRMGMSDLQARKLILIGAERRLLRRRHEQSSQFTR